MELPPLSSRWITRDGRRVLVAHSSPKKVVLLDEEEGDVITIQAWQWADAGLVPVVELEEARPINAAIVGGWANALHDRLRNQAADLGVELLYHYPSDVLVAPRKFPPDVDIVIFLTSVLSHSQYHNYKALAQKSRLPVAHVHHQGFKPKLEEELKKLGISTGFFGGSDEGASPLWYEWDGDEYVARTSDSEQDPSIIEALGILALLGLLFL